MSLGSSSTYHPLRCMPNRSSTNILIGNIVLNKSIMSITLNNKYHKIVDASLFLSIYKINYWWVSFIIEIKYKQGLSRLVIIRSCPILNQKSCQYILGVGFIKIVFFCSLLLSAMSMILYCLKCGWIYIILTFCSDICNTYKLYILIWFQNYRKSI